MRTVREEFGFARTVCDCAECTLNCHYIPGYLIPADLSRIAERLDYRDPVQFAPECLLASPGATVLERGQARQIPTLVPARRSDGACIFLDRQNHCRIHDVSPFGCAFFDAHQSRAESDSRSSQGLLQIARAWAANQLYAQLWLALRACDLTAPSPVIARQRMQAALVASQSPQTSTQDEQKL